MKSETFNVIKEKFLVSQLKDKNYDERGRLTEEAIKKLKISEKKDIMIALRRAYEDSQMRLVKGHGEISKELWEEKGPMDILCDAIFDYFNKDTVRSENDFDSWHAELCGDRDECHEKNFLAQYNVVIKKIKEKSEKSGKQNAGKAQKIVNMTLKYLSCYSDAEKFNEHFTHCHMPLDHYTLENWFCDKVKGKGKGIPRKEDIKSWSKLDYKTYYDIQKKIRKYLKEEKNENYYLETRTSSRYMTALEAEFLIWDEEKIKETLKSLENLNLSEVQPIYCNEDIMKLVKKVEDKLAVIKEKYK